MYSTGQVISLLSALAKVDNIPSLEVLTHITEAALESSTLPGLKQILFVGVQHILETTVSLFDALIKLGIDPENMYFTGKSYSSSLIIEEEIKKRNINLIHNIEQKTVGSFQESFNLQIKQLWHKVEEDLEKKDIKRIIVLDDGGRCLEAIPNFLKFKYKIVGIEQTRGGLYNIALNELPFPLIEVASSAIKKYIEPLFISNAVIKQLDQYLLKMPEPSKLICGVIGNGSIGKAIINHLLNKGFNVAVYDEDDSCFTPNKQFFRLNTIESLIANSDIIFGTTGKDVTQGLDILNSLYSDKCFISCSSEDKEFLTLLKQIGNNIKVHVNPLENIIYNKSPSVMLTILRGGFPINFDRKPWNVPASDIAITQGLLLSACIQAIFLYKDVIADGFFINKHSRYCLDPYTQRFTFKHWLKVNKNNIYSKEMLECLNDVNWIIKNSGGEYHESKYLKKCYANFKNINFTAKL